MQSATAYCGQMISQRFLNDTQNGIKNYRKIILGWLEGGIIHNPNKFGKKLSKNMMESWPYAISSNVPNILTHYALYNKLYGFSASIHQDIIQMGEAFYAQWDYYPLLIRGMPFKQKLCNLKSQYKVVVGINDHCGSYTARMATGGIYFGLEFNSQLAFDTGVRHLEIMLATFNKDAVYAAQAQRGICALGYMKQFPPHFELIHYAFQKAYGIDFINMKNINGVTPAEAYLKLWKIAHDPLETVVKYWNGFDQMNCTRNGKNQAAMVAKLKKDPSSYRDFWSGFSYEDFLLSSPILASQELPEEWKSLDNTKIRKGEGVLQTIAGGDWMGINPYLLQLALGNFEDDRREYAEEFKRIKDEELKLEKAERFRKREMLFAYDGTYKVQLGMNRGTIDGQIYQDLGSILFRLSRGQPKLDENNILYDSFGLNEIKFSLDYDGYMTVSGQILGEKKSEKKCVHLAGNLKSDKKFNPKSSQNCREDGQNFLMKFEKISDDINFNFAQEEDLKELDGEYDVQWFITGINSTERSLYAKDTLTLSKGVGAFSGNEEDKQPSSELRKELSVQYNANGDIVILGPLDLMEKKDVKQWHASGKIHPTEKTLIETVWGFGDIIELEIEKSKIFEVSKVIKPERLIDDGYFIYDEKNNSYQLNRYDEITGINQIDFSLSIDSDNEKLFNGDIAYSTSTNNFEITWIDLKIKETNEVLQNIKIGFVIEERSFPNFAKAFSISKNECGVFEDMADDSFIIPLKTDDLTELELFDCHIKVLQKNLNEDDFGILKDRINTAVSLVDTIEITNKYF